MSESEYDPLQKNRRLWNDSESIMSDSMAGIVMMHRNLVYLDNCKAVLRRDYNKMHERVPKIIFVNFSFTILNFFI